MPDMPRFQNEQPVLDAKPIVSKEESFEAFAKSFGEVASKAMETADNLAKEKSNAMLMQSSNLVDDVDTQTKIQLLKDPENASQIVASSNTTLDTIKQSSFVNNKDRAKLDYIIKQKGHNLAVEGAKAQVSQAKKATSIRLFEAYPNVMSQMDDALNSGDIKQAQILEESFMANTIAAFKSGAITVKQFETLSKSVHGAYDKAASLIKAASSKDGMSAQQYHAATASPFTDKPLTKEGHPVDQNTQWMANHLNEDRTIDGQFKALYNSKPVNWGVIANASNEKIEEFKLSIAGVNEIKGAFNAGVPVNQIDKRIETLAAKPNLTTKDKAEINYWKGWKERFRSENGFYNLLGQTAAGAAYTSEHQANKEAIKASGQTGGELYNALRDNDMHYIGQMVDLSRSQHIDPDLVRPIASEWTQEVESSFLFGAPVLPALQRIEYIAPEYRGYLAASIKKPYQAATVYLASQGMGKADNGFLADLLSANQNKVAQESKGDKRTSSSLLLSGDSAAQTKANNIWADIVNNNQEMSTLYAYLGKLPNGQVVQDGFRQSALNYVYYKAQKEGDVDLQNKDHYTGDFVRNTLKSFSLYRTDRALLNLNDLHITREQDVDHLVDYALAGAYKNLHEGKTEDDFLRYLDLNPLMVTNTPDGRLVVVDRQGRVATTDDGHAAFDMPFTSNMVPAAYKHAKEINEQMSQYFGFTETMRQKAALSPGFPFAIKPEKAKQAEKSFKKEITDAL